LGGGAPQQLQGALIAIFELKKKKQKVPFMTGESNSCDNQSEVTREALTRRKSRQRAVARMRVEPRR